MKQNKRIRISHTGDIVAVAHNAPGGEQCQTRSGNKATHLRKGSKNMTKQNKCNSFHIEKDTRGRPRILRNIKVCVICGNSNEVVDLSANPIMKETMSSYCEDDVDLDDCLSSVCITCVFKSRAVKEVQNKFKVRLKNVNNAHILKTSQSVSGFEYSYKEELAEKHQSYEKSSRKEEIIETNSETKHKPNIHDNGICELNNSSPGVIKVIETNDRSLRLPPASCLHASDLPLNSRTHVNGILDNSVEYMEHRNSFQLEYKSYRLNEISDCPTIQHVESYNSDCNVGVQTSLLTISNNHNSSMASSCSNSTHSQNGLSHSMLQVVRERPESVLITESGGKINNYKDSTRSARPQSQRVCQYCSNSYIRKDHYNKHVRRCRNLSSRSLPSFAVANAESRKQYNAKRIRTNCVIPTSTETTHKRARKFHCGECTTTFDNVTQLRKHRTTHLREYKCNMCNKSFSTLHEHDFHRIICLAEQQAHLEQQVINNQNISQWKNVNKSVANSERSTTTRRITRAQSRAQSQVAEKSIAMRRMTILTSVSQYISANNVDGNSDIGTCCSSNDDEDDVSVADSMNSKRKIYTDDWLQKRYVTEISNIPTIKIDSKKEYDLLLLERLKAQVKAQDFTCLVDNCDFFTDTLLNLMLHDYVHHFKASWFYCQKCGSVFTSKVFLDYHLDRQNGGRFICYKCNEQFMFQHQLDSHLILHTKNSSYGCNECKCEFLTEGKLYQHIRTEHSNKSGKKIIRIQSKATFATSYSSDEKEYISLKKRKSYRVKFLNMRLPRMPSKRPLELPGHKPYRRRIGIIEFENEKNPNCCSCK